MAKRERGRSRSRIKPKKEAEEDSKPRSRSKDREKPKSKSKQKKRSSPPPEEEPIKIVPPVPDKIECECGFTFKKIVEETYGSFQCPKCERSTSLEVKEKIVFNNKNIIVLVAAFVLCFVLYFGIEIVMGKLNEDRPSTFKLMDENEKPILEILPDED